MVRIVDHDGVSWSELWIARVRVKLRRYLHGVSAGAEFTIPGAYYILCINNIVITVSLINSIPDIQPIGPCSCDSVTVCCGVLFLRLSAQYT